MGILFNIGGAFSDIDNTLPYLEDPILSDGSIVLWDLSHSQGLFDGVPAEGATITNIAASRALAAIGSGTAADMDLLVDYHNVSPTTVKVERSGNLGLHVLPSQSAQTGSSGGVLLSPMEAIQTYLHAHTDDDWYFSLWYKLTRVGINGSLASPMHKMENTANYLFHCQNSNLNPSTGVNLLGRTQSPDGVNAPDGVRTTLTAGANVFRAISTTGFTGTKNALSNSASPSQGAGVGNASRGLQWVGGSTSTFAGFGLNKDPGIILYRGYAENLTVSGRTHAQVAAIDQAEFTAAFATGGRFNGDTYTDPATFA